MSSTGVLRAGLNRPVQPVSQTRGATDSARVRKTISKQFKLGRLKHTDAIAKWLERVVSSAGPADLENRIVYLQPTILLPSEVGKPARLESEEDVRDFRGVRQAVDLQETVVCKEHDLCLNIPIAIPVSDSRAPVDEMFDVRSHGDSCW